MSKEGLGWSSELNRSWIGSEGHTSHLSLDRLRTHCKAFDKGWEQYINDYTEEIAYDFGASSIIMTGEAIFPTTQNRKVGIERLDRMKDQVWELALETPEFMASMLFDLQDTTVIRETRRSGLAPHQTREDKAMKSYINEFIIARKK